MNKLTTRGVFFVMQPNLILKASANTRTKDEIAAKQ
jgi:hypothetical protein